MIFERHVVRPITLPAIRNAGPDSAGSQIQSANRGHGQREGKSNSEEGATPRSQATGRSSPPLLLSAGSFRFVGQITLAMAERTGAIIVAPIRVTLAQARVDARSTAFWATGSLYGFCFHFQYSTVRAR